MDLLEYQGKELFASFDIPVSAGKAVTDVESAVAAANEVGYPVVVKAQVLVGGRGKAGGVKLANNEDEAREHATNILGLDIKGHIVKILWIEHASDIDKEYYASFTLDRSAKKHLGMLSAEGGVEIEVVAEENPDAISKIWIDPYIGLTREQCAAWVADANLDDAAVEGAIDILMKLYTAYVEGDTDLAEINPLILTPEGKVHALDAKVTLDENAEFRHPEWAAYEGTQELDSRELMAKEKGLNYIGLDGEIGIIGNGAGLVMSTLDVVNQVEGRPANFLDVGGGADAELLANAIEVVNSDEKVRAIFLNIFGGITKCDDVANGVIEATSRVELKSPIVVRLDGTNAEEGRAILQANPNPMVVAAETMLDAAREAVKLSK
jgi:succinyl-CoA synthetase beta subunit